MRTFGGCPQIREGPLHCGVVAALLQLREPLGLPLADGLVHGVQLHIGVLVYFARVAVDADDYALPLLYLALVAEGGLLDLALHIAPLDGLHRATHLVYLPDVLPRRLLDG